MIDSISHVSVAVDMWEEGHDPDVAQVFVAGATGRLGARIVRELLKQPGIKLRAGVRDVEKAATYLQIAVDQGLLPADASKRIALVPVDVTKPETLKAAIGNAGKVGGVLSLTVALGWGRLHQVFKSLLLGQHVRKRLSVVQQTGPKGMKGNDLIVGLLWSVHPLKDHLRYATPAKWPLGSFQAKELVLTEMCGLSLHFEEWATAAVT
jgi:hypothetical protein